MALMDPTAGRSAPLIERLRVQQPEAIAELHALLLRAARFEVGRRRAALSHVRGEELDDIAQQAADDALMAVLGKLDDLPRREPVHDLGLQVRAARGRGQAAPPGLAAPRGRARARRLARAGRPRSRRTSRWSSAEFLEALGRAIDGSLTQHQRAVFVALALNEVPIDVLAERMATTRGALYKTLHDARKRLRRELREEEA